VRSAYFRPVFKWVFWLLVIDCIVLGWVGAHRPEGWFVIIGRIATFYYFLHFLILLPVIGWFEQPLPLPPSISSPVLKKGGRRLAASSARHKP